MKKIGGNSSVNNKYVSIIATHQARIRCFLSNLLNKKIDRFMNGAVVRVEINSDNILCTLVHQGELDENKPEKKYYVIDSSKTSPNYTAVPFQDVNVRVQSSYNTNGNTYVFFLIRHGQGTHNTLKGFKKKQAAVFGNKDTRLTPAGFDQAKNTGRAMINNPEFLEAKHLFSSDLTRTIETLVTVINQDSSNTIINNSGAKEIVVLPCSHELNYDSKGNCDGNNKAQAIVGNENKPSCAMLSDCIRKYNSFKINWNYYAQFYDTESTPPNGTRRSPGRLRKHCRDTNFLQEAIDIVNRREKAINIVMTKPIAKRRLTVGGKKRRTRKRKIVKRKRKTYKRKHRNKKRGTKSRKKRTKRKRRRSKRTRKK